MNCPRCGHPVSSVERTVRRPGSIVRTRQCTECRHGWQTVESLDDRGAAVFDELERVERTLKTAMAMLSRVI